MATAVTTPFPSPAVREPADRAAQPWLPSLALLLALSVVGFPFASTIPVVLSLPSTVATVPFRGLVLGLALWAFFRWMLVGGRLYSGMALLPMLALWTLLIARLAWDTIIDPISRVTDPEVGQFLALGLGATFLPALAFLERPGDETLRTASRLIQLLGFVCVLAVFWLGVTTLREGAVFQRLGIATLNPVSVGHLGASVFIVTACAALHARRHCLAVPAWLRWGRILSMLCACGAVVASFSRGPAAAVVFAAAMLMLFHEGFARSALKRLVAGLAIASAFVAAAVALVLYLEQNAIISAVFRLSQGLQDTASRERLSMAENALQQFESAPLLGDLLVERGLMTYPHNFVVETLMATGYPGGILLAVCLGLGTWYAWRLVRAAGEAAWLGLLYFQYLVLQLTSGSVFLGGTFWALFVACCVVGADMDARARAARQTG
jgi:O-antigen ligase